MYNNIMIPVALDHSADIRRSIAIASKLKDKGGTVTLVGVVEGVPDYVAEYMTVRNEDAILDKVKARLLDIAGGRDDIRVAVMSGQPGVSIAEMAADIAADLIIINSHRPNAQDYFLGSTASRVVRRAPCSVIVLR